MTAKTTMGERLGGVLVGTLLLCFVIIGIYKSTEQFRIADAPSVAERNRASSEQRDAAIFAAVKKKIEGDLLTPSVAKFGEPTIENFSPVTWRVYGTVDSQNANGAMLGKKYKAEVTGEGAFEVRNWQFLNA